MLDILLITQAKLLRVLQEGAFEPLGTNTPVRQSVGEPLVVFGTPSHRQGFSDHLTANGFDVDRLCESGQLSLFDARDTLSTFMVDGLPDPDLFKARIGSTIAGLRTASRTGRLRAYGEMVDLLWTDGNPEGMIALEDLWNDLG